MLIVGGGPVGLSAAIELARQGVASMLVEQNATTADHPRASVVNTRTAELCRAWGVVDEVYAEALEPKPDLGITWTTRLAGHELGRVLLVEDLERTLAEFASSPTIPAVCAQDRFEPILRRRASTMPGTDVRFGHELVGLEDVGDGVRAVVGAAAGEYEVVADWVIAADGAHSPIRRRLGVGLDGTGALAHQINVHFRLDLSPWSEGRPSLLFYVANPDVAGFMIALDGRERWLLNVPYRPDGDGTEGADGADRLAATYSTERCRALVRDAVGADVEPEIVSVQPWTVTAQVAERYRVGRVLLAGDAAHRFPPTGGFGMNTGVQDVHNLAWKLGMVLRGEAGEGLVDTYDAERRPVAVFNSEQSLKNGLGLADTGIPFAREALDLGVVEEDGEEGRALRAQIAARIPEQREHFDFRGQELGFAYSSDAVIDDGSPPAPFDVQVYTPSGRPGARAPHLWARRGGEEVSTLDLFGRGFCVLAGPSGDGWAEAASALDGASGLRFGMDLEGDGEDFRAQYGIDRDGAVLVRPDGHVAWRSVGGAGPAAGEVLRAAVDRVLYVVTPSRHR